MYVGICIPHGDKTPYQFIHALKLLELHSITALPDLRLGYVDIDTHIVSMARHYLVEKAGEAGVDKLFWLDDDVLPPEDTLVKLLAHNVDFISALYFARTYPYRPQIYERIGTAFKTMHKWGSGVIQVDAVGHGCCLVDSSVYHRLQVVPVPSVYGRSLSPWYEFLTQLGEDFYFCNRLAQIDVPVLVDTDVRCEHLTTSRVAAETFEELKMRGVVTDE